MNVLRRMRVAAALPPCCPLPDGPATLAPAPEVVFAALEPFVREGPAAVAAVEVVAAAVALERWAAVAEE